MFKKLSFLTGALVIVISSSLLITCKKSSDDSTPAATCSDGIQNQGETGVDCGGPCAACASASSLKATINSASWTATTSDIYKGGFAFVLKAGNPGGSPHDSIYIGLSTSVSLGSPLTINTGNVWINGVAYTGSNNGTITITDTANKKMTGTFNFISGGKSVASGVITKVTFHN